MSTYEERRNGTKGGKPLTPEQMRNRQKLADKATRDWFEGVKKRRGGEILSVSRAVELRAEEMRHGRMKGGSKIKVEVTCYS